MSGVSYRIGMFVVKHIQEIQCTTNNWSGHSCHDIMPKTLVKKKQDSKDGTTNTMMYKINKNQIWQKKKKKKKGPSFFNHKGPNGP